MYSSDHHVGPSQVGQGSARQCSVCVCVCVCVCVPFPSPEGCVHSLVLLQTLRSLCLPTVQPGPIIPHHHRPVCLWERENVACTGTVDPPYSGPSLQWTLPIVDPPYSGPSLQWTLPTVDPPYSGPSLQWTLPIVDPPYSGPSLQCNLPTVDPPYSGPSLQWTLPTV